jgi:uncharacterized protein YodC (DUF2158 family)
MQDEQGVVPMIGRRMSLRGGGPTLVVQDIISDEVVSCTWVNAMGKHKTDNFSLSGLEDLDGPADHAPALGGQLGIGPSVMLAALLLVIGLGNGWKSPGL